MTFPIKGVNVAFLNNSQFLDIDSVTCINNHDKMKFIIVIALFGLIAICSAADTYTNKFDDVDIDEILKSDRLVDNYYNCLMEEGPCTPDAHELRDNIGDALQTGCSKCTEKQKAAADKVLRYIIENKKDKFDKLSAKYDPKGIYIAKYRKEAAARGIKI